MGSPYPSVELMHIYCSLLRAPCVPSHHLCIHLRAFSLFTARSLGVKTARLLLPGKGGFMTYINVELSFKWQRGGKEIYISVPFKLWLENGQWDVSAFLNCWKGIKFAAHSLQTRDRVRGFNSKVILIPNLCIFCCWLVQWHCLHSVVIWTSVYESQQHCKLNNIYSPINWFVLTTILFSACWPPLWTEAAYSEAAS